MEITTTSEERYGRTVYHVYRNGVAFFLTTAGYTIAEELDLTEAIAEALPAQYDVRYHPARSAIGSEAYWAITEGDRTVAKARRVEDIVPAALRAAEAPKRQPVKPAAEEPAQVPLRSAAEVFGRRVVRVINHGDDHTTTYYSDGSSYDNEMGWTR
ncbi:MULTISPECIES: hypothetical protein [Bacteria]|uniref:hypothetical protein n=1 Tax=Bacteria TaxID=2 RepID=UPI003C7D2301